MSELIDKQAAIDAMQKLIIADDEEGLILMEYNQAVTDCIDKVAELLPVEQKQGWIPVSERLPKPYTWVYATCKSLVDDRDNWVIDTVYMPNKYDAEDRCGYRISDWGSVPMLNMGQAEVIAWMEWIRPEPYKKGSEDKG